MQGFTANKKKLYAYLGLIAVIFIWGAAPQFYAYFYKTYSPIVCSFICNLAATVSLIFIVGKRLRVIDKRYLKVGIPTGLISAAASILQKAGLLYTTPARYAFLENLSCVVVPVMMFIFIKQKPGIIKILSACLCLVGCFVLAGGYGDVGGFGIGEILCALAGILYGVNIAATGAFATKLEAPVYVFIHMAVSVVTAFVTFIALGNIEVGGAVLEPIRFEWSWVLILVIAIALLNNTLCWTIRTNVMKDIDATVVAIMMPFSAVVTGVISIIAGTDSPSPSLLIGALIVLAATIMSGFGDEKKADGTQKPTEQSSTLKDGSAVAEDSSKINNNPPSESAAAENADEADSVCATESIEAH